MRTAKKRIDVFEPPPCQRVKQSSEPAPLNGNAYSVQQTLNVLCSQFDLASGEQRISGSRYESVPSSEQAASNEANEM
ncbi:hypothetical protein TZ03_10935 [Pseudomonas sp. 10-1B]|nr:hypothetical protein TZ03_10935 [Pseudomonas sp. 10-1B]